MEQEGAEIRVCEIGRRGRRSLARPRPAAAALRRQPSQPRRARPPASLPPSSSSANPPRQQQPTADDGRQQHRQHTLDLARKRAHDEYRPGRGRQHPCDQPEPDGASPPLPIVVIGRSSRLGGEEEGGGDSPPSLPVPGLQHELEGDTGRLNSLSGRVACLLAAAVVVVGLGGDRRLPSLQGQTDWAGRGRRSFPRPPLPPPPTLPS